MTLQLEGERAHACREVDKLAGYEDMCPEKATLKITKGAKAAGEGPRIVRLRIAPLYCAVRSTRAGPREAEIGLR